MLFYSPYQSKSCSVLLSLSGKRMMWGAGLAGTANFLSFYSLWFTVRHFCVRLGFLLLLKPYFSLQSTLTNSCARERAELCITGRKQMGRWRPSSNGHCRWGSSASGAVLRTQKSVPKPYPTVWNHRGGLSLEQEHSLRTVLKTWRGFVLVSGCWAATLLRILCSLNLTCSDPGAA